MKWNDDHTITVTPPKRPKKITGTRFAAILEKNVWTTPFEAWCAITRTYEKPFEDSKYTIAGKTIEPKQADFMKDSYFMTNLLTPTDVFGEDYFQKTFGDFFPESEEFGGMWDYLLTDEEGKPTTVLEMKTTKRVEDWKDDIPEYYALQAALYAYLLGVDNVIMVCSVLEEGDYNKPEEYVPTVNNTFVRPFTLHQRYPDMDKTIKQMQKWWKDHVLNGVSPEYDEKRDAEILKVLRDNNLSPEADIEALVKEAEELTASIAEAKKAFDKDEKRLKKVKELLKAYTLEQFTDDTDTVTIPGVAFNWVCTRSMKDKINTEQMEADGVYDKYVTQEASYTFAAKKIKKEDK